jgi:hypothetical protein
MAGMTMRFLRASDPTLMGVKRNSMTVPPFSTFSSLILSLQGGRQADAAIQIRDCFSFGSQ